jgi:peptide/nickel transport system permease protein
MGYITRRLVYSLCTLLTVSILSFSFLELAPGEFVDDMRVDPTVAPETIEALRRQYGLTESLPVRYVRWLRGAATGDFGYSFAYHMPVSSLIWERARNTLLLTIPALAVGWSIALPIGIWAAARLGGWTDRASDASTSVMLTVPDVLLALLFLLLALRTGWFPTGGMASPGAADLDLLGRVKDAAAHAFLPLAALVVSTLPLILRHVRASLIEAVQAPAVQAARGHGIPRGRLLYRFALPRAANPLVSLAGLSVASLLSASFLTEVVMSWPGLGPLLLDAIMARDLYLIVAASLFSTLFLVFGNLAADVVLFAVDPRIRPGQGARA